MGYYWGGEMVYEEFAVGDRVILGRRCWILVAILMLMVVVRSWLGLDSGRAALVSVSCLRWPSGRYFARRTRVVDAIVVCELSASLVILVDELWWGRGVGGGDVCLERLPCRRTVCGLRSGAEWLKRSDRVVSV